MVVKNMMLKSVKKRKSKYSLIRGNRNIHVNTNYTKTNFKSNHQLRGNHIVIRLGCIIWTSKSLWSKKVEKGKGTKEATKT